MSVGTGSGTGVGAGSGMSVGMGCGMSIGTGVWGGRQRLTDARLGSWMIVDVSQRSAEAVAERRCKILEVATGLVDELKADFAIAVG